MNRNSNPQVVDVEVETYTDARIAEFLLSNAVDDSDYEAACDEVRAMGLAPDNITHFKPAT